MAFVDSVSILSTIGNKVSMVVGHFPVRQECIFRIDVWFTRSSDSGIFPVLSSLAIFSYKFGTSSSSGGGQGKKVGGLFRQKS